MWPTGAAPTAPPWSSTWVPPWPGTRPAKQDGPYLTTNDGLLEFNLVNSWQIYENLEANLELGYIVNMMDKDTWDKSYVSNRNWSKQDAWKAQLIFAYSF